MNGGGYGMAPPGGPGGMNGGGGEFPRAFCLSFCFILLFFFLFLFIFLFFLIFFVWLALLQTSHGKPRNLLPTTQERRVIAIILIDYLSHKILFPHLRSSRPPTSFIRKPTIPPSSPRRPTQTHGWASNGYAWWGIPTTASTTTSFRTRWCQPEPEPWRRWWIRTPRSTFRTIRTSRSTGCTGRSKRSSC